VSSPAQTFFLNSGASNIANSFVIDYQETIRIDAGATVTLFADAVDGQEIKNVDAQGAPLTISGTMLTQPYNGQFIQMDVMSVKPDPVSKPKTGAGFALSFDGTQLATVADAASLDSSDVTLEAWFRFSKMPSSFGIILAKPYQAGTADSYATWFEAGGIHAGTGQASTAGSAGIPFTIVADEWHHYAMTYQAAMGQTTLFIDGFPVSCAMTGAPSYDNHPLLIGADNDNGSSAGFWIGLVDEARVFSVARTADQIYADMYTRRLGPTPFLVGEWTFDEGTGQVASDSSGSKNDAVLGSTSGVDMNDATWVSSTAP